MIPNYSKKYRPNQINEINRWIDKYSEEWFYYNQFYVDYYKLIIEQSDIDDELFMETFEGRFNGLTYVKLEEFPIIFFGDDYNMEVNIGSEMGYTEKKTVNIGVLGKINIPQVGDFFVFNGLVYYIHSVDFDLYRKFYKCQTTIYTSFEELEDDIKVYEQENITDIESIQFNTKKTELMLLDVFKNNMNIVTETTGKTQQEIQEQYNENDNQTIVNTDQNENTQLVNDGLWDDNVIETIDFDDDLFFKDDEL